jgi:hypothetical protein
MNNPKPNTDLSPNLSTNFPATKPEEKRTIAKLEIINPIAVLLTPNDEANIGSAGIIRPKPTATKKEIEDNIAISDGISAKGFLRSFLGFILTAASFISKTVQMNYLEQYKCVVY